MQEEVQIKRIEGFPDYEITSDGQVISHKGCRGIKARILIPQKETHGYLQVLLFLDGKPCHKLVHRLVAEHFLPNPENKPHVNHLDANKQHNDKFNLEWCTRSENLLHARDLGLLGICKISMVEAIEIRELYKSKFWSRKKLSERYGLHIEHIQKITDNKTWKAA